MLALESRGESQCTEVRRPPAVGDAFRVVQFSVQNDHVHLIIEAHDADVLSRGVRGLAIRLARAVNRALHVRGAVWGDRFHARELTSPRAVRNAIVYVLMNAKKHGVRLASGLDAFSSARWFDGFAVHVDPETTRRSSSRRERGSRAAGGAVSVWCASTSARASPRNSALMRAPPPRRTPSDRDPKRARRRRRTTARQTRRARPRSPFAYAFSARGSRALLHRASR